MTPTSSLLPLPHPLPEDTPTDEQVAHVVSQYALGDLLVREDLAQGYVNWNCAVETTQGRFFLRRRHPALADPDLVRAHHQLMAHVRAEGIPAPRVHPTRGGETYLSHGGHVYEMHAWVSGQRHDDQNPRHLTAVGEMLARYHLAVRAFPPPGPLQQRRGWLYGPTVLERLLEVLAGRWPELNGWWKSMRTAGATIAQAHPQHAELTRLVIHGDYYADNILFEGERVVALTDYDNAAHQNRVVEVAEALIYFASQPDERLNVGVYGGLMDLEKAARFMAAYNAAWPLETEERAALPVTIQAIWLAVSLRRLQEQANPSPDEVLARLREAGILSGWATAHAAELKEVAGAGP